MKQILLFLVSATLVLAQAHTQLKPGDSAPEFKLRASTGKEISLSDYKGKVVVLAFFPAAYTSGCTKELTTYQTDIKKFQGMDVQVITVSTDFIATLSHWAKELDAAFPMASDHDHVATKAYGIYNDSGQLKGLATRTTFVIGPDGKIANVEEGNSAVDPTGAAAACERIKKKG